MNVGDAYIGSKNRSLHASVPIVWYRCKSKLDVLRMPARNVKWELVKPRFYTREMDLKSDQLLLFWMGKILPRQIVG